MSQNSIILYDDGDWSEGHYQSIFFLYTQAYLKNGVRVSVACPQPDVIQQQIMESCPEAVDLCRFHKIPSRNLKQKFRRLKPLTRAAWWARAGRITRRIHRLDHHSGPVFFMNITHLRGTVWTDRFTDRLMPTPWAAFIYDSSCVRGRPIDPKSIQHQFNFLHTTSCQAFGVMDEKMVAPLQKVFPEINIQFLPDTTPEEINALPPFAEKINPRSKGRKIVGLLGMLHKRKGLIKALELAEKRTDLFFVFAGACDLSKMTDEEKIFVHGLIDHQPENCFFHLHRIEKESDFNALLQQIDLVYAVYPHFTNTSGLLTKAGLFGTPCLVAEGDTCMADRVQKYDLGATVPADDLSAYSKAIDALLSETHSTCSNFPNDFNALALQNALRTLTENIINK